MRKESCPERRLEERESDWELAIALMQTTDNPFVIEKIAVILSGKSVNH